MEQLNYTWDYVKRLPNNLYVRAFCVLIYIIVIVSGVTLYSMLQHKPNLVWSFVNALIFSPVTTFCFWYVITQERYKDFDITKTIAQVFNIMVFISLPLNHFLLLINSAIAYAHPNKVNVAAITYTFVAFGWSAVAAILLTMISIQFYGIYLEVNKRCTSCYNRYRNRSNVTPDPNPDQMEKAEPTQNVLNEVAINNVMQEF